MKALDTIKLTELTLVVSMENVLVSNQMFCAMDYIKVDEGAQIIGWSERDLEIKVVKNNE